MECVGPEVLTFKEIIQKLLNAIGKKRFLLPLPLPIAKFQLKYYNYFQNRYLPKINLIY